MLLMTLSSTSQARRRVDINRVFDPRRISGYNDNNETLIVAVRKTPQTEDKIFQVLDWKEAFEGAVWKYQENPVLTGTLALLEFLDKFARENGVALKVRPFRFTATSNQPQTILKSVLNGTSDLGISMISENAARRQIYDFRWSFGTYRYNLLFHRH